MKRTKTIVADDGSSRVEVTIRARYDNLTKYESDREILRLCDGVHGALAEKFYTTNITFKK